MNNSNQESSAHENHSGKNRVGFDIATFSFALSCWVIMSGASYLLGFWGNFKIDIFSYGDISDILMASISPAIPAALIFLSLIFYNIILERIGACIGFLFKKSIFKKNENKSKDSSVKGKENKGKYNKIIGSVFGLISIAALCYLTYLIFENDYPLAIILIVIASIAITIALLNMKDKFGFINEKYYVLTSIFFGFFPLIFCFCGFVKGDQLKIKITNEEQPYYVEFDHKRCSSSPSEKFMYIGVFGEKLFAASSKGSSLCITKAEDFKLVKNNKEQAPPPPPPKPKDKPKKP